MTTPPRGFTKRRARVVGALLLVVSVGLPLVGRATSPDGGALFPSGAGLVLYLIGVVVAVLLVGLIVYGGRHPVEQVSLPRVVRSAVRWRDTVPPEYRDRVPGWLAWQRRLGAQLAVIAAWTSSFQLQLGAGGTDGGSEQSLIVAVLFAVPLVPIGIYLGFMERARRHFTGSLPAAE